MNPRGQYDGVKIRGFELLAKRTVSILTPASWRAYPMPIDRTYDAAFSMPEDLYTGTGKPFAVLMKELSTTSATRPGH
jgi:hypothetical protein